LWHLHHDSFDSITTPIIHRRGQRSTVFGEILPALLDVTEQRETSFTAPHQDKITGNIENISELSDNMSCRKAESIQSLVFFCPVIGVDQTLNPFLQLR